MYRIMQDGMVVASSTSLSEAIHYAHVYIEDGPVEIQSKKSGRWVAAMSMRHWGEGDD